MRVDEGYIKFTSDWTPGPPPERSIVDLLNTWRRPLHEAGLIGHYAEPGIGYGNISARCDQPGKFVISGTQTGHLPVPDAEHYALVTAYDIAGNSVSCTGMVQASSESLTHAAIYELDPTIGAVVHVHSKRLWRELLGQLPTTSESISYGTPEMANEFKRLYKTTAFAKTGIAIMAGHEEGIISMGVTLDQAANRVLKINPDCQKR